MLMGPDSPGSPLGPLEPGGPWVPEGPGTATPQRKKKKLVVITKEPNDKSGPDFWIETFVSL